MKVVIDEILLDDSEVEIHIQCKQVTKEVLRLQDLLTQTLIAQDTLLLFKDDRQYHVQLTDILFFETTNRQVIAHTKKDFYRVKYKLYELEDILPGLFYRISKSTIVNTNQVLSISNSFTSIKEVQFKNSLKTVIVSRNYYKQLVDRLKRREK